MNTPINIAQLCPSSTTLGPGRRFVLWVQGCPFKCRNCISPEWIPMRTAQVMPVQELAEQILNQPEIEGLTISGGEPFLQGSALSELLAIVLAERPSLNVLVFTGFQLDALNWPEAQAFLQHIDVLIAGLYVEKKNDGRGLRGSRNQVVHYLTPRLEAHRYELEEAPRDLEFHIDDSGVLLVGIPEKNFQW